MAVIAKKGELWPKSMKLMPNAHFHPDLFKIGMGMVGAGLPQYLNNWEGPRRLKRILLVTKLRSGVNL